MVKPPVPMAVFLYSVPYNKKLVAHYLGAIGQNCHPSSILIVFFIQAMMSRGHCMPQLSLLFSSPLPPRELPNKAH